MLFCHLLIFFQNQLFSKNSFRNSIRVSNSLDPDQNRHFVGPDLDANCLQTLSADDTSKQSYQMSIDMRLPKMWLCITGDFLPFSFGPIPNRK